MRISTFFKCIFLVICLFIMGVQAQVVSSTLNVTAGNLSVQLGSQKELITDLTLTWNINGDDIGTIHSMAKLAKINLVDVNIVTCKFSPRISFSVSFFNLIKTTKK